MYSSGYAKSKVCYGRDYTNTCVLVFPNFPFSQVKPCGFVSGSGMRTGLISATKRWTLKGRCAIQGTWTLEGNLPGRVVQTGTIPWDFVRVRNPPLC